MNNLIIEGNNLFKDCSFPYYVCGGFALELFVGKSMRAHGDLDISVFYENKRDVAALLHSNGWDIYKRVFEPGSLGGITPLVDANDSKLDEVRTIWAMKQGSHLPPKPRNDGTYIYDFEILSHEQKGFNFIEVVLDYNDGDHFVCGKDKKIARKLDKAILFSDEGVPYMAPELVLFLKSPQVYSTHEIHRKKTPADFKAVFPLLPDESKKWLIDALDTTYTDGYEWLEGYLV